MEPIITFALPVLLLAISVNSQPMDIDMNCAIRKCRQKFAECAANRVCQKKIACSSQCGEGSKARCLYDCGYLDKGTPYGPWVDCLTISGCFKTSVFGQCIGEDGDADQSITSISELNGIWWNVKGLDCDGEFGFDTGRVCTKLDVNTHSTGDSDYLASFCFGTGSTCNSEVLSFNKTLKFRAPGVILAKSFDGVSKIPKFERHRFLALAGDYVLVSTCSRVKIHRVHQFNVFSRKKNFDQIKPEELDILRTATAKHGIDLDKMCNLDNSACA